MNNYFFSFTPNIYYDCSRCEAYCCHAGGNLMLSQKSQKIIEKYYPQLAKNFVHLGSYNYLKTLDVCWFLDNNLKCSLQNQHSAKSKPLSCQLFPFIVSQGPSNYLIVRMIPCPGIKFPKNLNRGKKYIKDIKELISQNPSLVEMAPANKYPRYAKLNSAKTISWNERFQIEEKIKAANLKQFDTLYSLINYYSKVSNSKIKIDKLISNLKNKKTISLISFLIPLYRTKPNILKLNVSNSWQPTLKLINKFIKVYPQFQDTKLGILNSWHIVGKET